MNTEPGNEDDLNERNEEGLEGGEGAEGAMDGDLGATINTQLDFDGTIKSPAEGEEPIDEDAEEKRDIVPE